MTKTVCKRTKMSQGNPLRQILQRPNFDSSCRCLVFLLQEWLKFVKRSVLWRTSKRLWAFASEGPIFIVNCSSSPRIKRVSGDVPRRGKKAIVTKTCYRISIKGLRRRQPQAQESFILVCQYLGVNGWLGQSFFFFWGSLLGKAEADAERPIIEGKAHKRLLSKLEE